MTSILMGSKESTKDLLDFLHSERSDEAKNEAIHAWLPGVKSLVPLDYINDISSAFQVVPSLDFGEVGISIQIFNKKVTVDIYHRDFTWDSSVTSNTLQMALIVASVNFCFQNM